jgi:hypothetical protein
LIILLKFNLHAITYAAPLTSIQPKFTQQFSQHSFALCRANECSSALCNAGGALRANRKKCDLIGRLKPCVIASLDSLPAHCHSRIAIITRLAGASVVIYVMRRVTAGVCFQSAPSLYNSTTILGIQNSCARANALLKPLDQAPMHFSNN